MQNPQLAPILGSVASPANRTNRLRQSGLEDLQRNLDIDLENVTAVAEDGRVDMITTQDRAVHYNSNLTRYNEEAELLAIVTAGAVEVDGAIFGVTQRLLIHWDVATWTFQRPNHIMNTGPTACRVMHWIVRFGALTREEISILCGRVHRGHTVFYACKQLITRHFLIRGRRGGLDMLRLGNKFKSLVVGVGGVGMRVERDLVAFDAAMEAGHELIRSRR